MYRLAFVSIACAASLWAQRTLEYDHSVVSQVRIDARDLGYPPVDVIPDGESAIRALTVGPDGTVYGATSGKRSQLFVLYPVHGYVQPLGYLKDVSTVHRAVVVAKDGQVYIGGSNGVDTQGAGYEHYAGGHLLRYTPKNDEAKPIRIDTPCEVADLGIPVPGEGVYAMTIDRARDIIYGLTYPNGQFFSYSIPDRKFTIIGKVAEKQIPGERFEHDKNISRELFVDSKGFVFASGENAALFRFDPTSHKWEKLRITAPTVLGREPYNRVDAWTEDQYGTLFGGTADGYLFRLDPATLQLTNLGKPLNQYRIRGLAFGRNGKLYGVGGDEDEMARLFSYDPTTGSYEMLGMVDVNRRPYYSWQAYVIDAVVAGADGTIYIGQAERKSKLYLYYPN
jgi:outer membrane protein assembly factor BamB